MSHVLNTIIIIKARCHWSIIYIFSKNLPPRIKNSSSFLFLNYFKENVGIIFTIKHSKSHIYNKIFILDSLYRIVQIQPQIHNLGHLKPLYGNYYRATFNQITRIKLFNPPPLSVITESPKNHSFKQLKQIIYFAILYQSY